MHAEHSKGHARQSFHVIGALRFKNGGGGEVGWGARGRGNQKISLPAKR